MQNNVKITRNYRVGDTVKMSDAALENDSYPDEFKHETLIITSVYLSTKTHPGFDANCGYALYSTRVAITAAPVPFDLYDLELEKV